MEVVVEGLPYVSFALVGPSTEVFEEARFALVVPRLIEKAAEEAGAWVGEWRGRIEPIPHHVDG